VQAAIMKSTVLTRLALPTAMAIFLLLSLAYWWLDNLPHEIFGTLLFALLGWHIAVNRTWFKKLFSGQYDARRIITLVLHLLLIGNMAVLLVTSVIISKSVFASLPIPDSVPLRDIHWFSAYWVMVIVGTHIGLHWVRVMAMARTVVKARPHSNASTFILRVAAVFLAAFGAWSYLVLGVWTKLTFTYSLDFWDFTASVSPFFGHWAGVVALPAIITHYTMVWWRGRGRSGAVSQRIHQGHKGR
jgi:hypothetical protein